MKTIKELDEAFASETSKYNETKAASNDEMSSLKDTCAYLSNAVSYMRDRMYAMDNQMYSSMSKHTENHVPSLKAGAMKKFLKAVGMEEDMNVSAPTIHCSASNKADKKGNILVSLTKEDKNVQK